MWFLLVSVVIFGIFVLGPYANSITFGEDKNTCNLVKSRKYFELKWIIG